VSLATSLVCTICLILPSLPVSHCLGIRSSTEKQYFKSSSSTCPWCWYFTSSSESCWSIFFLSNLAYITAASWYEWHWNRECWLRHAWDDCNMVLTRRSIQGACSVHSIRDSWLMRGCMVLDTVLCYSMLSNCYIATEVLELAHTKLDAACWPWIEHDDEIETMWLPCSYDVVLWLLTRIESACWRTENREIGLYAVGTGYCNWVDLELNMTTKSRRLRCCVVTANSTWICLLRTLELRVWLIRCWYWLIVLDWLESKMTTRTKLATYTTMSQSDIHWLHAACSTTWVPKKCLCRDIWLRDIGVVLLLTDNLATRIELGSLPSAVSCTS